MQAITHPEHAESHATHLREGYFMGCLPAEVTSVKDPNNAGRIKCRSSIIDEFSDLPNGVDGWIPVTTSYVLTDTPGGTLAPLQVGSQVILVPVMGKMNDWICFGAIHTTAEPPHASHSRADGSYGERTPEGITHVRTGAAAEVKTYPHGVIKGVTATGDVMTKTTDTTITQSADGKVHLENKNSSTSMSPSGTVTTTNAVGSSMTLTDKGTVTMASAHKSSMSFVDGKVEIAGPPNNKETAAKIDEYKKTISKSVGGLNEMFAQIASVDLSKLDTTSVNGIIGAANDVIAKGSAIVADYEKAKTQAESLLTTITQNPAEALKIIAPEVSTFLDNNLDKVLPTIKSAIASNIGGAGVLAQIEAYLPSDVTTTASAIQAQLSAFKTDPSLAASAIVSDIYKTTTADFQSLLGAKIEYSIADIIAIRQATAPTWTDSRVAATQLLITQSALATTLAGSNNQTVDIDRASPTEIATKLAELHAAEPDFLDSAIAAAWRKSKISKLEAALPTVVRKKLTLTTFEEIIDATDDATAISKLALALQAANLKAAISENTALDTGVAALGTTSQIVKSLDLDDKDKVVTELFGLSGNTAFGSVNFLLDKVDTVDLTKPIVRNIIGDFQTAMTAVEQRLNARFKTEDPLCQSTIRFVFNALEAYTGARVKTWAKLNGSGESWTIDAISLTFWTNQLIVDTRKYQTSYKDINFFWDDLVRTVEEFIATQQAIDKEVAYRAIAAQIAATSSDTVTTTNGIARTITSNADTSDWVAPESFAPESFADLKTSIGQLRVNLAQIPILTSGCDNSDQNVSDLGNAAMVEILAFIESAGKSPLPFAALTRSYTSFEKYTATYKDTSKIRADALKLFKDTLEELFAAERTLAASRHAKTVADEAKRKRLNSVATEAGKIAYAIAIKEFRAMGTRVLKNLSDTTKTTDYAQNVTRIVSELNVVVQDWFGRNATSNSAAELIDLPGLQDLSTTIKKFVTDRADYQDEFPQVNLVWDEIASTLDYLLYYPTTEALVSGTNTERRSSEVKLPGTYATTTAAVTPPVSQSDWLQAAIAIAKSVMQDITNLYAPFKEYQAVAVQVLDTLPKIFPSAKMTLTDGKIAMKSSNTGSLINLGEETAKLVSGASGAALALGKGAADLTTGAAGGALKLASGSGELSGGAAGGTVKATTGGATLSGPGGICSIGAGAGGLNFSTPWGGFGFGSGGFGLSGDQPVSFAVSEADNDGGTSALYLDAKKGVGIHSTDIYTNNVNAFINVFDGRITISCPGTNNANIEVSAEGVIIGGVNMTYFSTQFGYIWNRLNALESSGGS